MSPDTPRTWSTRLARPHSSRGLTRTKLLVVIAGLAVAGVGGAFAFGIGSPKDSKGAKSRDAAPSSTDIAQATRTSFDITTNAMGELEAKNQVEIRSKLETQALITEIVPEGSHAKAGDVLIRLNSDQIKQQLDEENLRVLSAKADLAAAEYAYDIQISENESDARKAQLKIDLAALALQQWMEGDVMKDRQKNDLALDKARRELDRLKAKFEQSEVLLKQGFLSKDERDQDELKYIQAQADLATAELQKDIYEKYEFPKDEKTKRSDLDEANSERDRVKFKAGISLASKEADKVNKQRQLALREEKVQKLNEQFAACTMTAPSDGLVVYYTSLSRGQGFIMMGGDGPLQVGRNVRPNETLIVLPDTTEMVATVRVQESLAGRIQQGQPATLKIDAAGGRSFAGRVDSIGVLAESGGWRDPNLREYTVKVAILPDADTSGAPAGLKPSMRCEALLTLGRADDIVAVPLQAVFNEGPVRFVYAPRGSGKFAKVPVKVGRRSETFAEVSAGLSENDRVLLREPTVGEIMDTGWDADQLALVGFTVGDDGHPKPIEIAAAPKPAAPATAPAQGSAQSVAAAPGTPASAIKTAEVPAPAKTVEKPATGAAASAAKPVTAPAR
jgi:HlyD family secretion protein